MPLNPKPHNLNLPAWRLHTKAPYQFAMCLGGWKEHCKVPTVGQVKPEGYRLYWNKGLHESKPSMQYAGWLKTCSDLRVGIFRSASLNKRLIEHSWALWKLYGKKPMQESDAVASIACINVTTQEGLYA
jgi:hypothetical protein